MEHAKLYKDIDIAWASGLIEGEGCFTSHTGSPYILVDSTDQDVILKLHAVFPSGNVRGPYTHKKHPGHKPRWRYDVFGTKAVPILKILYPYMCSRRKAKIDELLGSNWRTPKLQLEVKEEPVEFRFCDNRRESHWGSDWVDDGV